MSWHNTQHLVFSSKQQAAEVLAPYRADILHVSIDEIGVLYDENQTDQLDDQGQMIIEYTPKIGWHVNVRSKHAINFGEFEIQVETPSRVFA